MEKFEAWDGQSSARRWHISALGNGAEIDVAGRFHHDGAKAWEIKLHPQALSFSMMIHHILALQEINTAFFIGLLFLCNCMLKVTCFLLHRERNIEFDIISQIITKLKASRRSVPNMMSVKKSKIEI